MKTVVAIPMKDAAESKTRLAGAMSAVQRERMALALFRRAQTFFAVQFPGFERLVVTPSPRIAAMATDAGAVSLMEQGPCGLNHAAGCAFRWAREHGFDRLLVVPADIPVWLRAEVDELLEHGRTHPLVIARAHDGGTNALLIDLTQAVHFDFRYGPDSASRHGQAAADAALCSTTRTWPFLSHDIDTVDDCLVLAQELSLLIDAE
ncbi:MAG: 2-phospho-L-lactate guanylyltransferase [Pseudomonadota bacterium]